jgi:hypothetical protein
MKFQIWPRELRWCPMSAREDVPLYRLEARDETAALDAAHQYFRADYGPIDREDFALRFKAVAL